MNKLKEFIDLVKNESWDAIKTFPLEFVRSQDHLAVHDSNAGGRVLSAYETATYYPDKLDEILEYGVASLPCSRNEPAETIRAVRESFGGSLAEWARFAQVEERVLIDAEDEATRTHIDDLQKIAQALGIDDAFLSIKPNSGEHSFGYRLRSFNEHDEITRRDVMAFSEASWVAQTQLKLESWLGITPSLSLDLFEKSPDYGDSNNPAWKIGYELADKSRKILDVKGDSVFLGKTCSLLGIPVIQTKLSENIAGATISTGGVRAIVVANDRRHNDVLIRRTTVAHELGHLLWDTDEHLKDVRIDTFDHVASNPEITNHDAPSEKYVEQRANAFAVHFIAPINAGWGANINDDTRLVISAVERYGISVTSATFHLHNRLGRSVTPQIIDEEGLDRGSWEGPESFGLDMFPQIGTPISRQGLFSYRVVKCYKEKLITESTAASYLKCTKEDFLSNCDAILKMFE